MAERTLKHNDACLEHDPSLATTESKHTRTAQHHMLLPFRISVKLL
eukprot:COSAG06_NODE_13153_length_1288_cov_1.280067_3_plen_45_part_01